MAVPDVIEEPAHAVDHVLRNFSVLDFAQNVVVVRKVLNMSARDEVGNDLCNEAEE